MTADVDLPPLPDGWNARILNEWGRACVAHATAAKDAEIEALRAEVAKQSAYAKRTHDWNTELLANNERLAEALRIAIRQNSHDMLLTGDELRQCEAALHPTAAQENGRG